MIFANVEKLMIPEGEVVKISHGSTVLWERPGIPSAYRQVEYIESDGNSYIDTGVLASDYTDLITYDTKMMLTEVVSSKNVYFFGCLANYMRSGNIGYNGNNIYVYIGTLGSNIFTTRISRPNVNEEFTLTATIAAPQSDATAVLNGVKYITANTYKSDMPSANIWLFACNINGSPSATTSIPCTARLYYFSMTAADGTPIRNFIPCYRVADGVIGLYDTVGGMFYTNKGTGSFTKGADV